MLNMYGGHSMMLVTFNMQTLRHGEVTGYFTVLLSRPRNVLRKGGVPSELKGNFKVKFCSHSLLAKNTLLIEGSSLQRPTQRNE
jgi:hypothetical protein